MFCKKKKKRKKIQTAKRHEETCSTSLIIRECKSKPHKKKYHPTVVRMAAMKMTAFKKCC